MSNEGELELGDEENLFKDELFEEPTLNLEPTSSGGFTQNSSQSTFAPIMQASSQIKVDSAPLPPIASHPLSVQFKAPMQPNQASSGDSLRILNDIFQYTFTLPPILSKIQVAIIQLYKNPSEELYKSVGSELQSIFNKTAEALVALEKTHSACHLNYIEVLR